MAHKHLPGFLYHREYGSKIFYEDDKYQQALKDGWVDSPAKIIEPVPVRVEATHVPEDAPAAPKMDGLDMMTRTELEIFAKHEYDLTFHHRLSDNNVKKAIRDHVASLIKTEA